MKDLFNIDNIVGIKKNVAAESAKKLREKSLIFFGAGEAGKTAQHILNYFSINPDFYCDNDPKKQGTTYSNVPVISFNELVNEYSNSNIIITSRNHRTELQQQLRNAGLMEFSDTNWLFDVIWLFDDMDFYFKGSLHLALQKLENECIQVYRILADDFSKKVFYDFFNYRITLDPKYLLPLKSDSKQYFEKGIINLSNSERFIDCGAYTGDTVDEFLNQSRNKFSEIYSFEPDVSKHNLFNRKFGGNKNIHLLPFGVWNKTDNLRFFLYENTPSSNKICGDGDFIIPVVSIDEILQGSVATFIKMDIEGAELEALKGAEKTIKKFKPKLAISVYHKPLDIIAIPLYIKELVPEYKFYLRHYGEYYNETVFYAIAE